MVGFAERLRRLSINDRRYLDAVLSGSGSPDALGRSEGLEPRMCALARIAALVALDGPTASFDCAVAAALAAGASPDDVVDAMVSVGPTVGSAHLVSAAPKVALALGYDVADDLEQLDPLPAH
jgi:4-carboxymuconolactone decarboxylase